MKLKERAFIKHFGKDEINEKIILNSGNRLIINFSTFPNLNLDEAIDIINQFPNINVSIVSNSLETIENAVNTVQLKTQRPITTILQITSKKAFEAISDEELKRVKIDRLIFSKERTIEDINIGDIEQKFPNVSDIDYFCKLDINNVTRLSQVSYMAERSRTLSLSPMVCNSYRRYIERHPEKVKSRISFGTQKIWNINLLNEYNANNDKFFSCPACDLIKQQEFSNLVQDSSDKPIVLLASNMGDVPLDLAIRLKQNGVNCKIQLVDFDSQKTQKIYYNLDEYIAISQKMQELIGDIDSNLPEKEKFRLIYERVVTYIEYDYPAGYPKNRKEREYSKENKNNCRNLKNGLLYGKAVCAGYAYILKQACILKGIECEYISGPVDSLDSKTSYKMKRKEDRPIVVCTEKGKFITREYHAWNKVKIDGIWYNCDPTWDKNDIMKKIVPRFALVSDESYRKRGRPTVEALRHPCTEDVDSQSKKNFFPDLKLAKDFDFDNKIVEFENTVDEYGKPRELPIVPKDFLVYRVARKTKNFFQSQVRKIKSAIMDRGQNNNIKIDEEVVQDSDDIRQPAKEKRKVNPWEVSDDIKKAVERVERKQYSANMDYKEKIGREIDE